MVQFALESPPQDDEELYWCVRSMWGVSLPRHTCGNIEHTAPFTAFADAYFGRGHPTALWHGSRGLSGKSFMLAALGITKAFLIGCDVNILGGSLAQSTNVHEHMREAMHHKNAPRYMIQDEGQYKVTLTNGSRIRPLTASQRTVRGPHPALLLLDEIDEMDLDILDAALGQPMPQENYLGEIIEPYTVLCSTWQVPDGTFTAIKKRFEERNLPTVQWCYLCTSNPIDGWLSQSTIDQKILDIPAEMWRTEYCGASYQLINTPHRVKKLEDISVGDEVLTRDGWRPITHKWDMGMKEIVHITTKDGHNLYFTPNHKILTENGWKIVEELAVGDGLVSSLPSSVRSDLVASSRDSHRQTLAVETVPMSLLVKDNPLGTMPVAALSVSEISSINDVIGSSHQAEMLGIDTESCVTVMIDSETVRDRSVERDVADSMSEILSPGNRVQFANPVLLPFPDSTFGLPDPASIIVDDDSGFEMSDGISNPRKTTLSSFVETQLTSGDPFPRYFDTTVDTCISHVASISPGGTEHVYDITVDGKHEFSADGIIVHNCLGEPAIGNRAFDPSAIEHIFNNPFKPLAEKISKDYEEYTFEEPVKTGSYVVGADWGKEQDYTVISVMRYDEYDKPARLVYWMKVNRRPYPQMIGWFNKAIQRYHAEAIHDGTGLGNVVNDYVDLRARSFIMTGASRDNMLSEYVSAVENGKVQYPKFKSNYIAHKFARVGDLYGRSKDFHLPDEVCSLALAWKVIKRSGRVGGNPIILTRDLTPTRLESHFLPEEKRTKDPQSKIISVTVEEPDAISLMV